MNFPGIFKRVLLLVFTSFLLFACRDENNLRITGDGSTEYKIIVSSNASDYNLKAAQELQKYIERISGVLIPVEDDNTIERNYEIIVGKSRRIEDTGFNIDFDELGDDGFVIKTVGKKLIIAGGKEKGSLYGVYTFLEDYLGCRKYSERVTVIPENENITIGKIDDKQIPCFTFREMHFYGPRHSELYRDWHKLDMKEGKNEWGMFVHTFDDLVPPEKYFKTHPEYFSYLNIQRIPDGQLCLSNPDVYSIVVEGLKERMKEKPEALYWSVSQNDTYKACECDECKKLYEKYGGYSGAYVWFVNKVARQFPDKIISTLAYQFTRQAPTGIKPDSNVNIMFCSIECNRSKPLATDPSSASFRRDAENWCKLTENIFMWDYIVQFRSLINPFPNLRVLQPNLQYFRDLNMKMMFQQGSGGIKSEFYELRQYLDAKLLWNPDADVNAIIDDFVNGYYGPAGKYIRQYIDKMHDALEKSGKNLNIYGYPYDGIDSYLTPGLIKEYTRLFDNAEAAVKDYPDYLERVKTARLPLQFAIFDISLHNVNDDLTYFRLENDKWVPRKEMLDSLHRFISYIKQQNITKFWEHGNYPDDYETTVTKYVNSSMKNHLALNKPVTLFTECSPKYDVGGAKALTDGLKGINDYHFNWLGFEGEDMVAVIDLEKVQKIHTIETGFLQENYSWIFLPQQVDFFISVDGKSYRKVGAVKNIIPDKKDGVFIQSFNSEFTPTEARFVKVFAKSMKTCPDWHPGAGNPSWIFCDEVSVW